MKQLLLLPFLLMSVGFAFGQSAITGKVLDEEGTGISFANVILNATTDSSMVKLEYTNDDGTFSLLGIQPAEYWLTVSYVGKADYNSEPFTYATGGKMEFPTITMTAVSSELEEVTVTGIRPILEVKPDKLVFNVEGSVNAVGNDGMELLRKAPGVVIDNNDNISLAGKNGVRIFINGKPSPLGAEDLANYLKSINSTEIDNIEIITNPSAKYEAEGNAGIINIRLKKDKNLGANATVNLGYGHGRTWDYSGGFSANYRNKVSNTFGSYAYRRGNMYWGMESSREFGGLTYNAESLSTGPRKSHNFKLGTDFYIGKKNTLGFLVTGNLSDNISNNNSQNQIGTVGAEGIDSILVSTTERNNDSDNYTFNINYKLDLDKEKSLNMDADYGRFRQDGNELLPNQYVDVAGNVLSEETSFTTSPSQIDIYTFKLDYEQPLWKGKVGMGFKNSLVITNNEFDFYNRINDMDELDTGRSSQFEYFENVNAAYLTYAKGLGKKWNISAGLRMEQTNTKGTLTSYVPENDPDPTVRNYVDFFPSGGLTYTPNYKHNFSLTYSRRLDRPNYQNLNPFKYRINELSFSEGNPFLRPQYANSFQLSHTFNYRYSTSVGFTHTKDLMTRVSDVQGQALTLTWKNITNQYTYNVTFSAPLTITKWWGSYTNLTAFHTRNVAEASAEIQAVDLRVTSATIYTQHTFSLPWKLKFELSGWASTPSVWGGVFRTDAMYSIDAGISKKLLKDKANLKISVGDIFFSSGWSGSNEYGAALYDASGYWDSRRVRLNFSYFFGNDKVKSRKRKTGLEDEKGRAGGGGGQGGR